MDCSFQRMKGVSLRCSTRSAFEAKVVFFHHPLVGAIRKICLLALLGFAALVLAGPILVVAFFAILGLGAYFLGQLMWRGKGPAKQVAIRAAGGARRAVYEVTCRCLSNVGKGINSIRPKVAVDVPPVPKSRIVVAKEPRPSRVAYLARVVIEMVSGSAVGTLLAAALVYYMNRLGEMGPAIAIGASAGGLVGLVLGLSRTDSKSQQSFGSA
jgi:hypothetical protein